MLSESSLSKRPHILNTQQLNPTSYFPKTGHEKRTDVLNLLLVAWFDDYEGKKKTNNVPTLS